MIWWISGALALIGALLWWWVKSQSTPGYDADGNMWLIAPFLLSWGLIAMGALCAIGGLIALAIRHIHFS